VSSEVGQQLSETGQPFVAPKEGGTALAPVGTSLAIAAIGVETTRKEERS
jgi:hypothetical protein